MKTVFLSYSHRDMRHAENLLLHLKLLERQGVIEALYDREIEPGDHLDESIQTLMDSASIVLLLISANFLACDYCYEVELQYLRSRQEIGLVRLIPVILSPCDWKSSPLGRFKALPADGKPIVKYDCQDDAFLEISGAIRGICESRNREPTHSSVSSSKQEIDCKRLHTTHIDYLELQLRTEFSVRDYHDFLMKSFEHIEDYFERSLRVLRKKYPSIQTRFIKIDKTSFEARVHTPRPNQDLICGIWMRSEMGW